MIQDGDYIQIAIPPNQNERQAQNNHNMVDTDEDETKETDRSRAEDNGVLQIHVQGGRVVHLEGAGVTNDGRQAALRAAGIAEEDYEVARTLMVDYYIPMVGFCYDAYHTHMLVTNTPKDRTQVLILAHIVYQDKGE